LLHLFDRAENRCHLLWPFFRRDTLFVLVAATGQEISYPQSQAGDQQSRADDGKCQAQRSSRADEHRPDRQYQRPGCWPGKFDSFGFCGKIGLISHDRSSSSQVRHQVDHAEYDNPDAIDEVPVPRHQLHGRVILGGQFLRQGQSQYQ